MSGGERIVCKNTLMGDADHGPGCDGPLNCTCPAPVFPFPGRDVLSVVADAFDQYVRAMTMDPARVPAMIVWSGLDITWQAFFAGRVEGITETVSYVSVRPMYASTFAVREVQG